VEATRVIIESVPSDPWQAWGVGVQIVAAVLTLLAAGAAWWAAKAAATSAAATERSATAEEGQHRLDQASALARLRDEWNHLRGVRRAFCEEKLRDSRCNGELSQQLFSFFEWLGLAVASGLVDVEGSWHVFEEVVFHYHRVLQEIMTDDDRLEPIRWCKFRELEEAYQAISLRLRGRRETVTDREFNRFIKAEADLRDTIVCEPFGYARSPVRFPAED